MKLSFDTRDFLLGFVIVIAVSLFILSSTKDTQISIMKKQAASIESEYKITINETSSAFEKQISDITEVNNLLYGSCVQVTQCKELYNFNLRSIFLEKGGFNETKQVKREAYVITGGVPKFSEGADFAKKNCPKFSAGPLGTMYSLYHYSMKNATIGIIMNDDDISVHCAWVKNGDNYNAIFP